MQKYLQNNINCFTANLLFLTHFPNLGNWAARPQIIDILLVNFPCACLNELFAMKKIAK